MNMLLSGTKPADKDQQLLEQLLRREVSAMGVLYDNYSTALFGVALRIVRNQQQAEDVLQEAFLKIWSCIDTYSPEKGRLFTWMLNIVRNHAIDYLRSKQCLKEFRTESLEDGSVRYYSDFDSAIKPEHIGLKKLVEELKPELKVVIELLFFGGYTHSEAAEELQIPLGTLKTRARSALKQLAMVLK